MKNILHYFSKIQDNRKNQGKRYKLNSILALVTLGYMHGCKSLATISRFGKKLIRSKKKRLGFTSGSTPSYPTITEIIKNIDITALQKILGRVTTIQMKPDFTQIAIDGKSIRSTHESALGLLHLLSAYATEECGVLAQVKSGLAGGEIIAASKVLSEIDLKDKVVTGDAMFAQESLCTQITRAEGNYLFKVKKNKKRIVNDIAQEFYYHNGQNLAILSFEAEATKGRGRIDLRCIEVIEVRDKYFGGLDTIKQIASYSGYCFYGRCEQYYLTYIASKQRCNEEPSYFLIE